MTADTTQVLTDAQIEALVNEKCPHFYDAHDGISMGELIEVVRAALVSQPATGEAAQGVQATDADFDALCMEVHDSLFPHVGIDRANQYANVSKFGRALLAAYGVPALPTPTTPAQPMACPNCGGSATTWKCTCSPIWPVYTTAPAASAEPVTELREKLKDPALVHAAMLLGEIAKPGIREMLHLHGEAALARWDAAPAASGARDAETFRALLVEAYEMADHWPGIAYTYDLCQRIDEALAARTSADEKGQSNGG